MGVQRFACTQCGKCCNRSPEVELSEAAALSDTFVFRLMFRLYWLPGQLSDYRRMVEPTANSSSVFFEKKRLLNVFAARKYSAMALLEGKPVAYTKYLVISALALDTVEGACGALRDKTCGIYGRRPLSCRSVPLHYSRAEALAERDLAAFVGTSGYRCDTSDSAPIILKDGRIVDPQIRAARSDAIEVAKNDHCWSKAIVRRMGGSASSGETLPSLEDIEANAAVGATTIPMRTAWQIAAEAGLISQSDCDRLVELQLGAIRQELTHGRCSRETIVTLTEMESEYGHHPKGPPSIAIRG